MKVLKHWKLYKDAYILQESLAMTDKSYPPLCCNYLLLLYLSVTLYACAQRDNWRVQVDLNCSRLSEFKSNTNHATVPIKYTPLSVSQVLNSHSHVMYILSILLAKYTEIKVSLKSHKTMA